MDTRALGKVLQNLMRIRDQGVLEQQEKEKYLLLANKVNTLYQEMAEQRISLRSLSDMALEVNNNELFESLEETRKSINRELTLLIEIEIVAKSIALI